MYDIALSVAACARSGTRADVAWMVAPEVSDEALALTRFATPHVRKDGHGRLRRG